jgi:hypothetical protein
MLRLELVTIVRCLNDVEKPTKHMVFLSLDLMLRTLLNALITSCPLKMSIMSFQFVCKILVEIFSENPLPQSYVRRYWNFEYVELKKWTEKIDFLC